METKTLEAHTTIGQTMSLREEAHKQRMRQPRSLREKIHTTTYTIQCMKITKRRKKKVNDVDTKMLIQEAHTVTIQTMSLREEAHKQWARQPRSLREEAHTATYAIRYMENEEKDFDYVETKTKIQRAHKTIGQTIPL